jgi:hypothetical protein
MIMGYRKHISPFGQYLMLMLLALENEHVPIFCGLSRHPLPWFSFLGLSIQPNLHSILTDNPDIGLNDVTRNSSAIFMTWSKFPDLESGMTPEPGWYANYVYAMLPRTKAHLKKKCEGYKVDSTPFRKHGRKAYVRGYMHGFCNKANMFDPDACPSTLEFVPFIEIMEIDWASSDTTASVQDIPATPSKTNVKSDITSSKRKHKIAFDPFADGSSLTFEKILETKSDSLTRRTTTADVSNHTKIASRLTCANYYRF